MIRIDSEKELYNSTIGFTLITYIGQTIYLSRLKKQQERITCAVQPTLSNVRFLWHFSFAGIMVFMEEKINLIYFDREKFLPGVHGKHWQYH